MSRTYLRRSVIVASSIFAMTASAWAGQITLSNPSFESPSSGNPDGWGIGATDLADVSTDFHHSGAQSLKFTTAANQNTDAFNPVVGAATGGTTTPVQLSAFFYTPSTNTLSGVLLVLQIEFKKSIAGGGDTTVSNFEQVFVPESLTPNAWTPLTFTATSTASWDILILHVRTAGSAGATGVVYADDVTAATTPEPASLGLLAVSAAGLLRRRRRA